VIAFDVILRGINLRYLDYYLRFVLAILIFLALRKIKVSLTPLITGILMGSIGAGIFALYQKSVISHQKQSLLVIVIRKKSIFFLFWLMGCELDNDRSK
jgi:hypothetical protein